MVGCYFLSVSPLLSTATLLSTALGFRIPGSASEAMDLQSMEVAETHSSEYGLGPPWLFKGSALYQLHLVKAEVARAFIPKEFKLVEAFGYTLGGLFLAHYDDSPAGMFDELVVIAGIVWNPPTSCAWAARVVVNSVDACRHGRKEIGLPSHVAIFSKRSLETVEKPITENRGFLNMIGIGSACYNPKEHSEIQVSEVNGSSQMTLCNIILPFVAPQLKSSNGWMGPMIRMSLPSFSGQTIHIPHLLKYSCQIECRVRTVATAKVSRPTKHNDRTPWDGDLQNGLSAEDAWNRSISVLLSKPILALEFNLLKMHVEAPKVMVARSKTKGKFKD